MCGLPMGWAEEDKREFEHRLVHGMESWLDLHDEMEGRARRRRRSQELNLVLNEAFERWPTLPNADDRAPTPEKQERLVEFTVEIER